MTTAQIDRILQLSTRRRATPEDTAFIGEVAGQLGLNYCATCPNSVRQVFSQIVARAHTEKNALDAQIAQQTAEMEKKLIEEEEQQRMMSATTLDFTIDADCVHCLYKQPVAELTKEQRTRLINEVSTRCGVTIKNCTDCTDDLLRAQDILREHMLNVGK